MVVGVVAGRLGVVPEFAVVEFLKVPFVPITVRSKNLRYGYYFCALIRVFFPKNKSYLYDYIIPHWMHSIAYPDAVACIVVPAAEIFPQPVCVSVSACAAPADERFSASPYPNRAGVAATGGRGVRLFFAAVAIVTDVLEAVFEFYAECLFAARTASSALVFSDAAVSVAV